MSILAKYNNSCHTLSSILISDTKQIKFYWDNNVMTTVGTINELFTKGSIITKHAYSTPNIITAGVHILMMSLPDIFYINLSSK
jgi:hypothetical protein